ncbi:hypothetical protein EI94DRAFT_1795542 [Lactarius quietus]|nr:hypothetical protein EI94DRAFT_1795542 [Lactarius quietus]
MLDQRAGDHRMDALVAAECDSGDLRPSKAQAEPEVQARVSTRSLVAMLVLGASTALVGPIYLFHGQMPSASFQPVLDAALADYTKNVWIDFVKHPFVDQLRTCHSPDEVLELLEHKAN